MSNRKAFNFLKSYYDVYKKLENKDDKIQYIEAILERQFYGVQPKLKGMADFAYTSQQHAIDKSVKGFEDRTRTTLRPPVQDPTQDPTQGCTQDPTEQEKEKEKEKEKDKSVDFNFDLYLKFINELFGKNLRVVNKKAKQSIKARLKEGYTKGDIWNSMQNVANDQWHKDNNYQYATPQYFAQVKTLDMHSHKPNQQKNQIGGHTEYLLHD